tara:strand:- start:14911 stop:15099 length:189 start_codon:yes stop_codon:yes gene_type:complete
VSSDRVHLYQGFFQEIVVKDLIWPFGHAKDIGYIIWPIAATGVIGAGSTLIILAFLWPVIRP